MTIDRKQEYACNDAVVGEQRPSSSPTGGAHSAVENVFNGHLPTRDSARLRAAPTLGTDDADWSVWGAARDGARVTLTRAQIVCLALLAGLVVTLACANLHVLLTMLIALMTCVYLLSGLHKAWLITRGERAISNTAGCPGVATDDDLPRYTVLVALHREGRILPVLVKRLAAIDYPRARLEILLLIESDDMETQRALKTCALPAHIRPVIVPPGQPRTKPRALNVGLACATGEFIVIYDAEDRPEPDQLRKAVAAFRAAPADVICVQARLNFYNWRQSILATLFAVDYTVWYDLMLPGLTQAAAFVPLGGTSNHFRIEALHRLGGWDPFNVTEDCDLGVRIARERSHIAMLDSTTWEEAVPHIRHWIKQRSRWVKGYLQTYLVHMRHPLRLWHEMGPRGFADFQLLAGAQSLVLLLNPAVWLLTATYALSKGTGLGNFIESLFPAPLYYLALLSFVFGNFVFLYINLYGCVRRGYDHFARYALLSPIYWVLMSVGAWAGFISLIRHPHYWAKTEHGVSLPRLVDEQHALSPLHDVGRRRDVRQPKRLALLVCLASVLACLAVLSAPWAHGQPWAHLVAAFPDGTNVRRRAIGAPRHARPATTHASPVHLAPPTTLYFAEGYTGRLSTNGRATFEESLAVHNTTPVTATVTITYLFPQGRPLVVTRTLGPHATRHESVNADIGPDKIAAAVVSSAAHITAMRLIRRVGARGLSLGASSTPGTARLGTTFSFATGHSGPSVQEYLTVANPGRAAAHVRVTLSPITRAGAARAQGPSETFTVPAHRRTTWNVGHDTWPLTTTSESLNVSSDQPIVVERVLYTGHGDGSAKYGATATALK